MMINKNYVLCPICEKKQSVEANRTIPKKYPQLKNAYLHSKITCDFCKQEMLVLYNKENSTFKAVNEAWLLELKSHNSFTDRLNYIIDEMEHEVIKTGSIKIEVELIKLKKTREKVLKKHKRVQNKFIKLRKEWRTNLLINELGSINRQSDSED